MTHSPRPAFSSTSGASRPKLVLVGEAWGEGEETLHKPFVGESGKELFRMLGEAMPEIAPELHRRICDLHRFDLAWVASRDEWFEAAGIALTNVLAFRPPQNKLEALCASKKELTAAGEIRPASDYPLAKGKYLRGEFLSELPRLHEELTSWAPNLIVALGNTATWALLQATNIGSIRGTVAASTTQPGMKVLPTYHPAGVLRMWAWRPLVVADLMKARREAQFPEIRRPRRRILLDPTLAELEAWTSATLATPPPFLSPDVETASGQITCIGFARARDEAIVVPFWDRRKPGWSYWSEAWEEERAWECVRRLLESRIPKVGQNFIYDLQYITKMAIRPQACREDTMLLHHAKFPELQKGLGFLGSIYTDETSWKLMRKRKADTEKKDE